MIKKVLSALVAISLILTYGTIAFADSDMSVTAILDISSGKVSLSGYADSLVSITVAESDVTFENYMTELDKCIFFGFVSPEDGQFRQSFQVPSSAPGGKYVVYVSSDSDDAQTSFMKPGDVSEDVLDLVNTAADGEELKSVAEANSDPLGIDKDHPQYTDVSAYAYDIIFASGKDYESSGEFYEDYNAAYAISLIAQGADAKDALKQNAVHLGISYSADFENDDRLDDDIKLELLSLIQGKDWEDMMKASDDIASVFGEEFKNLKAVASVRMCDTRVQLQSVIEEDFKEEFSFVKENSKYKKLKNADKVYEEMIKSSKNSKTPEDVKKLFESAVSKVYKSENSDTSSGGGGGGGGNFGYEEKPTVGISSSYGNDEDKTAEDKENVSAFSDVEKNYWGYEAIDTLTKKGIIKGYEDSSFRPEGLITRAEFAKLMVSLCEDANVTFENEALVFDDVNSYEWYYDSVQKASGLGIIKGADGKVNPQSVITRQDAALMIHRVLSLMGKSVQGSKEFSDSENISDYAKDAVLSLASEGYINGVGNGSFAPLSNLTRAQAAQIIYNVIK